jgi:PTS system nitrogen regulatory IIA component
MNRPLNRVIQDASWTDIASIRDPGDRLLHDLHFDLASGSGRKDLFDFGRADGTGVSPAQASRRGAQYRMEIADLLSEQDVVLGLPAEGKRSALARMAASLGEKAGMSQGFVLAAMLRRERLGSTATGRGVAIPHARIEGILAPTAVLATLQRPVWFDAPDGEPVDVLLALLWPKTDTAGFLQALSCFSRLLPHERLREHIRAAETSAEALAWIEAFGEKVADPSSGKLFSLGGRRFPHLFREALA